MKPNYLCIALATTLFIFFNIQAQTFTGNSGSIPDESCDASNEFTTTVTGVGTLGDLSVFENVTLNISHTYVEDLDISLISPNGTEVLLSSDNGGSGDNYINTRFSASASNSIVTGTAPFTGDFLPEGNLSNFNNVTADGLWTLKVCDDFAEDIGSLGLWSITFRPINDDNVAPRALTVGIDFNSQAVVGTVIGATPSSIPNPTNCGLDSTAQIADSDVYYLAIIPASGNLTIETGMETGSSLSDTILAVYHLGALLACDDLSGEGLFSKIELTGRTPGEQILIRAWAFNNNNLDHFKISVYDNSLLTHVPDDNFENYLETHNANGDIVSVGDPTSMGNGIANDNYVITANINTVANLNVEGENIANLTGIEGFTALIDLNCEYNALTSLDVTNNINLEVLKFYSNQIQTIDVSQNIALTDLHAGNNLLTNLNVTNNTQLNILHFNGNQNITNINLTANTALTELRCNNSQLSSLDLSTNTQLTDLRCYNNQLTSLDLSANTQLIYLSCDNNQITSLDLLENSLLNNLFCNDNQLTGLNMANGNNFDLEDLRINDNPNLTCVTVDDETIANNWNNGINTPSIFLVDPQTQFNGSGTCAPFNDLPTDATTLTVGGNFEQYAIIGDNTHATASETTITSIPAPTCSIYAGQDLWYAIEIPEDGSVIIETGTDNSIIDTALEVYSGTTGNLESILCHDDIDLSTSPQNLFSRITLINRIPGEIIYARVWEYQDNETGTFKISAYRNPAISTYVPDNLFENWLETHDTSGAVVPVGDPTSMGNGVDGDDYVLTDRINTVTHLGMTLHTFLPEAITNMEGIQAFTALTSLTVNYGGFTSIDLSQNINLESISLHEDNLITLDLSNNIALTSVSIFDSELTLINLNGLTALSWLKLDYNNLTALDISQNTDLSVLICDNNQIPSLDVSQNASLTRLECYGNSLVSLNIANSNNSNFNTLTTNFNPDLTCITVDDQTIADNWNNNIDRPSTFNKDTQQVFSADCSVTTVELKAYLQGAFLNPRLFEESFMRDDLRVLGHLPTTSPYADNATISGDPFDTSDIDAVVDWVWVELRCDEDNTQVVDGQSALLQRDGDIVGTDGISPLVFNQPAKHYNVAVNHRNHSGIISNSRQPFPLNQVQDYRDGSSTALGNNAMVNMNGTMALWAGDLNNDGTIKFSGASNDVNTLKDFIIANAPLPLLTITVSGYLDEDLDLNGDAKFSGSDNDSNLIKDIILAHPANILNFSTFTINTQIPNN